jgi:LysM repeat protein
MKKLRQIIGEDINKLRKDAQNFYKQSFGTEPPTSLKDTRPVDFTGSRHSDGTTVAVANQVVTPDKPLVGKDDAVGKLLASKGYGRSGEKLPNPLQGKLDAFRKSENDYHDKFAKDMNTKFQQASTKPTKPESKPEPKVGALVAPQSGYPAAKKETLAPAENQKASSGKSYKIQDNDNPTRIAKKLGMSLAELEKKNPGLLKRAKKLKIGGSLNI